MAEEVQFLVEAAFAVLQLILAVLVVSVASLNVSIFILFTIVQCLKGQLLESVCNQPKMVGTCLSYQTRYWFNTGSQLCEPFTYSGCQGNENNFVTSLDCQNYCRNVRRQSLIQEI